MVLVPTHTVHTGIRFHPSPAQRTGEGVEHQPFVSLEVASVLNATEEKSAPPGVPLHTVPSFICNDFLNLNISLCFRHIGPAGMMSMFPLRRKAGREITLKC